MRFSIGAFLLSTVAVCSANIVRMSESSLSAQANDESYYLGISGDGRFVAFCSRATNLLGGVGPFQRGRWQVYLKDSTTAQVELISISSDGTPSAGSSRQVAVSADGRFVAFTSWAPNWAPFSNGVQVYVRNRAHRTTSIISVNSAGDPAIGACGQVAISRDGRYVAYVTDAPNMGAFGSNYKVFFHDRVTAKTECVSLNIYGNSPNDDSFRPSISDDGRYVVYESYASDIAPTGIYNSREVYFYDRANGKTKHISLSPAGYALGGAKATISGDGRHVAFETMSNPGFTFAQRGFGMFVVVRDLETGLYEWVNQASGPGPDNPVYHYPTISGDGNFVAFTDYRALVPGDTNGLDDVYIRDLRARRTVRITESRSGEANAMSLHTSISDDGSRVAFQSTASNLIASDTNEAPDVFLWILK